MFGRCCRCDSLGTPSFYDCFGCLVTTEDVPQEWILDVPSAFGYAAGIPTTNSTSETVGPYLNKKTEIVTEYQFPSISSFGSTTSMVIDDMPITNPLGSYTTCIWASNFDIYESEIHDPANIVPWNLFTGTCFGTGLVLNPAQKTAPTTQPSPWEHRNFNGFGGIVPHGYSLNRTRNLKASTPLSECGKTYCGIPTRRTTCGWRPYGIYGILQIYTGFVFRLSVVFMPRMTSRVIAYELRGFPTGWYPLYGEPENWDWWDTPLLSSYTSYGDDGTHTYAWKTLFPNFVAESVVPAPGTAASGIICQYEKTINCATDFSGSPVVLTLSNETIYGTSGEKCWHLLGLSAPPSTVTITPV